MAYVSQEAWLRNDTLEKNIYFGGKSRRDRYEQVLDVCALRPDIDMLPAGDQTEIGEKVGKKTLPTVYPKKYAHGFVVLCFVVVMQSFIMNSHEVFTHIHQGCFAGTGAIVRLPQCQWSKPDGYGKISQCITTTKHSKARTVCIFLGIYCMSPLERSLSISQYPCTAQRTGH